MRVDVRSCVTGHRPSAPRLRSTSRLMRVALTSVHPTSGLHPVHPGCTSGYGDWWAGMLAGACSGLCAYFPPRPPPKAASAAGLDFYWLSYKLAEIEFAAALQAYPRSIRCPSRLRCRSSHQRPHPETKSRPLVAPALRTYRPPLRSRCLLLGPHQAHT
jgi:hypothetical protein